MMPQEEAFFSVDVEASGPIPGEFSMLSLGCSLVTDPEKTFYCELKPISEKVVAEALRVSGFDLQALRQSGRDPALAMAEFESWVTATSGSRKPLCVGFNASFDWQFINYYFHRYLGRNVFGIGAIDIKSYYMGLERTAWDATRSSQIKSAYKSDYAEGSGSSHNALKDAIQQAAMFRRMLR
jgi:ribonuclease T